MVQPRVSLLQRPVLYFGLKQGNGGPCGILATVQAEILGEMLFKDSNTEFSSIHLESEVTVGNLLAAAICNVLYRAAEGTMFKLYTFPRLVETSPCMTGTYLT